MRLLGRRHRLACIALSLPLAACLLLPCGCGPGGNGPSGEPGPGRAEEMHFYFGSLHGHTEYSDGAGTPAEAYAWARDTAGFDFFAVTDHGEKLSSVEWEETGAQADSFDSPGEFVALRGFEWSHPSLGHVVVLGTADYTGAQAEGDLHSLYAWIAARGALAQFNHPGDPAGCFGAFAYDPGVEDDMCLLETGNKDEGNNDGTYYPYYPTALDRGWRVAPAANQDNHRLSANSHRTVIVAPELTRGALLDALQARRVYASDDPDMRVTFKLGEEWMGSAVSFSSPTASFLVEIEDDESIALLELFTNEGRVVASLDLEAGGNRRVTWNPEVPVSGDCYFYLRVTERDEKGDDDSGSEFQVAITAPIWLHLEDRACPASSASPARYRARMPRLDTGDNLHPWVTLPISLAFREPVLLSPSSTAQGVRKKMRHRLSSGSLSCREGRVGIIDAMFRKETRA